MSSNKPKIVFKPYTSSFNMMDDNKKDVVSKLSDAATTLKNFKDWVQGGLNFAKPFLALARSNPLTIIVKSVKKYLQDMLQTFFSSGFYMLVVHPWNQAGKRTKKIKFNLLNPLNEIGQTVQGFQTINENQKIYSKIEELEELRFKARGNIINENNYSKQIAEQRKLLKPENYVQEHWIKPIDWKVPVLSYSNAIDEIIKSLDNTSDINRPKWTKANNFVAWGLIIGVDDPIELIEKFQIINKLIQFTNLSKSLEKFNKDMRTISATATSKIRTNRITNDGWTVEGKNLFDDIRNETDKKEKLKKLGEFLYSNTLEKPLTQTVAGSYPAWFSLSIDKLPYMKQLKDKFFKYFDELLIVAETTDSMINNIIDAILDKINWIMKLVDDFNELLVFLQNLELAIAGVTFTINEDLKYKDGGGISLLKSSLQQIKNLDTALFDPTMSQEDISKEIDKLRLCEYTAVVFATAAGTNFDLLENQWNNFTNLLGYELSKDFKDFQKSLEKDKKESLGDIDYYDDSRKAIVEVNEELRVENPVLVEKDFVLTLIPDPFVKSLDFSLISTSNSKFSTLSSSYNSLVERSIITRNLRNLPDNESFSLTVNYIDINNNDYTKIINFTTNFSLFNSINTQDDPNTSESSSDSTSESSSFDPSYTPIETESGIIELPDNINSDSYSSAVLLTNTTGATQYYSIIGPNGDVLYYNIPLIIGSPTSIEFIGLDGAYTIIIYSNGKIELISRQVTKISSYARITQKALDDVNIYILTDSLYFLFPETLGKYIFINNKIYELPAFIPLDAGNYSYFLIDQNGKYSEEKLLKLIQSSNLSGNNCLEIRTL